MNRAKWQHWQHPKTGKWDAQCHKAGRVLFFSRQGYNRESDCLNAIESAAGRRTSDHIDFKNRVRSPRSK